jgi:hypothetical protein
MVNAHSINLFINGSSYPVTLAGNHSSLKLVSLQGNIVKEYGERTSKSIVENQRIIPGVYFLLSSYGEKTIQNKIVIR